MKNNRPTGKPARSLKTAALMGLVLSAVWAGQAAAQEGVTQQTMQNKVANEGLTKSIELLQTQITSATARLMLIKKCHENGKFFGTLDNGKEDCIDVLPTCTVPWSGATMKIGESITAYASPSVIFGAACQSEKRLCDPATGKLSGSYGYESCKPDTGLDCALPWGGLISSTLTYSGPVTSSTMVTAFASSTVPFGSSCVSETRVCTNGALSGSYTSPTCTITPPADCPLPWGGTVTHGTKVTAYSSTSVPYTSTCASVSETRQCYNGTLSGSYPYNSCVVTPPPPCNLPWGGTINPGQSVKAYSTNKVVYPATCEAVSQMRTCTNGVLTGSYTQPGCVVAPPPGLPPPNIAVAMDCSVDAKHCQYITVYMADGSSQSHFIGCGDGGWARPRIWVSYRSQPTGMYTYHSIIKQNISERGFTYRGEDGSDGDYNDVICRFSW